MRLIPSLAGSIALLAGAALPLAAQPVATPAGTPLTTATLANICSVSGTEGDIAVATGYCRGFIIGVGQYHRGITAPGGRPPVYCLPDPAPAMAEVQASFVTWAAANTQYADEKAVDGLLRWAAATYPCAAPQRARRR